MNRLRCCPCPRGLSLNDPNSYSNPEEMYVDRMEITWTIDFDKKMISGNVLYSVIRLKKECQSIILDMKDLNIISINRDGTDLDYLYTDVDQDFGQALKIKIPEFDDDQKSNFRIDYDCFGTCSLQWLMPAQTHGKTHPYMFSQGQAINNRSLLPCQDTPGTKASYCANVSVPPDFLVLMSAIADPAGPELNAGLLTYKFEQRLPIPAYLIAIAVGRLDSRSIGPRSTLYAEPGIVDEAAEEFSETEEFLKTAEKFAGPYVWKTYDILVLPPSFPYGGMENPNLTFATPTLLAGDKSLTDVVAHEIAHSWTGNMVTNKNYEHFWLNEGWTMFLERKITGHLRGEKVRQFHSLLGLQELKDCLTTSGMAKRLTQLVPDLRGINPDDSFSTIPYEKGYTLLYYLEQRVGTQAMEKYMLNYINCHKFQSIDTNEWKRHLVKFFKDEGMESHISGINWKKWLYSPGLPPEIPDYDQSLIQPSEDLYTRWMDWKTETPCKFRTSDLDAFSLKAYQIHDMLGRILDDSRPFSVVKVKAMENVYHLNAIRNCEIRCCWSRVCIKARWLESLNSILKFITEQGRMKYLGPIYRELYDWPEARQRTIDTFKINRPNMMNVSALKIAKTLHLSPNSDGGAGAWIAE